MKPFYFLQKKNTTTIAVEVKKSQHKYVVGPKGNTLQEILDRTGVSVEIPPSDSGSETVILRGEPDRLGQALTEVYAKVKLPSDSDVYVCACTNNVAEVRIIRGQVRVLFIFSLFVLFAGKQLYCFLGLSSLLASSIHHWQEGAELGQDYPTNAQG